MAQKPSPDDMVQAIKTFIVDGYPRVKEGDILRGSAPIVQLKPYLFKTLDKAPA